jgi:hypothetical protein
VTWKHLETTFKCDDERNRPALELLLAGGSAWLNNTDLLCRNRQMYKPLFKHKFLI